MTLLLMYVLWGDESDYVDVSFSSLVLYQRCLVEVRFLFSQQFLFKYRIHVQQDMLVLRYLEFLKDLPLKRQCCRERYF